MPHVSESTPRVIAVTGANGSIGSAVVRRALTQGHSVHACFNHRDNRLRRLASEDNSELMVAKVDCTDLEQLREWVRECAGLSGGLDALVHCVGRGYAFEAFEGQDPDTWGSILLTELGTALLTAKAVLSELRRSGRGRLVFLSSDSAKVGTRGLAVSAAARGGVNAFVKSLAREVATDGMTVNALCPGPVASDTFDTLVGQDDRAARVASRIPMGRLATPDEVARVALFLASDADFITGQAISVSGGLTMQ